MIRKPSGYFLQLLFFAAILIYSCNKTDDGTPPALHISSPDDHDQFSVGDNIHVVGTVTHKFPVKSIKISLWDNFNVPVLNPLYVYPDDYGYNLDEMYPINDASLESGTYILMIAASDGHNTAKVYRTLYITGVQRYFERLLALVQPNTLKTIVYALDTAGNYQDVLELPHGYAGSEISSGQRQLYILKPEPSSMTAYSLDNIAEEYVYAASPPYAVFYDVYYNDQITYVSSGNGNITGLNSTGSTVYVTPQNTDTIPLLLHQHFDLLLSSCNRRGGPEKFIRQHFAGTGVFRAGLNVDFSGAGFFSVDEGSALILGNMTDESSIFVYDVHNNYLADKTDMPPGLIRDAVQISAGNYLISHDAGIYHYIHESKSLYELIPGVEVDAMAYDYTRLLLYYAEGAKISVYMMENAEIIDEITLPYPVLKLHIQYNN
ncbi:MAG: hypothetical protein HQ565_01770 [Bacteroidetes bacterium]|nr:hypothetical protein [Bacteroidota bacterium]